MLLATGEQIRKADQIMIEELSFPGVILMEEAGRKAAEAILQRYGNFAEFVVLAGPGNNGGDGFVIARYLKRSGKQVRIIVSHSPENYKGDALVNLKTLDGSGIPVQIGLSGEREVFSSKAILIDALLGTGIKDALRGPVLEIMEVVRTLNNPIVAIDLPSGLNADTGYVLNDPLDSDCTITFQLPKVCHVVHPAAGRCGDIIVADIGIWPKVVQDLTIERHWVEGNTAREILRSRPEDGHKGTFGHAVLVGGSSQYPGAIALSGHAALHIGAGLSTVVAPETSRSAVFGLGPEVIFRSLDGERISGSHLDAVVTWSEGKAIGLGPGWSTHPEVKEFFLKFLRQAERPIVLDADALNLIAAEQCWGLIPKKSILTPHPGELRRLLGKEDKIDHRLEDAEALAKLYDLVIVLKGAGTIIASTDQTWVNSTGNSGMGTGGSGDVLTGVITGLLAQGYSSEAAAVLGVYVHGLAGDLAARKFGENGLTASRIMEHLGPAMVNILEHQEPQIQTI